MPDDSRSKPPTPPLPAEADDWRTLAAKASTENDSQKLSQIVRQLCDKLDERAAQLHPKKSSQPDDPAKPLDAKTSRA